MIQTANEYYNTVYGELAERRRRNRDRTRDKMARRQPDKMERHDAGPSTAPWAGPTSQKTSVVPPAAAAACSLDDPDGCEACQ